MSSEWPERLIGDIAAIVGGSTPSTADASNFDGDVPWLTPRDLSGLHDRYVTRGVRSLSAKGLASCSASLVPKGTVLLTTRAPIGYVAIAKNPISTNQGFRNLVLTDAADPEFIYYWLLAHVDELERHASGSTFRELTGTSLKLIKLQLPPFGEQRAIAGILGALDDKIELNRRMSQTLEAITQALFRSWFVSAEESADWKTRGLDEIARFVNGLALQKYPATVGKGLPAIKIAQLRSGNTSGSDLASADLGDDYVVNDGDVLFSWSGSLECRVWRGGRGALNQHLFKVTSDAYPKWFYFFWIHEHLEEFRHIAAGKATTMGHIQRHHLSDAKVLVPPARTVQAADRVVSPMFDRLLNLGLESRTLGRLRDALLPKLVSGEVRLSPQLQVRSNK